MTSLAQIETLLHDHLLVFCLVLSRVSGLIAIAPIYGSRDVPVRVRGLLAVALALLIAPSQVRHSPESLQTGSDFVIAAAAELVIGLVLGLGMLILLTGIQLAGQMISQLSGMALADVFQPGLDTRMPVISQLLVQVTLAIFLLVGGHRLVMAGLLETFGTVPPGSGMAYRPVVSAVTTLLAQSFILAVRAAAPAMTALLLATLLLGLVSRTMPQINILVVGFGINSMVTLVMILLSLATIAWTFSEVLVPAWSELKTAIGSGSPLHVNSVELPAGR